MKYTRKQIVEAIQYWTRRLSAMNESKIKVLDDLIDAFGEKTVLSKERRFRSTTAELRTIYDILNRNLFENKDEQLTEVQMFDDIVMRNFNRSGLSIFIFVVACLCHEMIHYYDRFSDEFKSHIFKRTVDSDDIETDNLKSR